MNTIPMEDTFKHYLNDCIHQLIEMAKVADDKSEFNQGKRFGYFSSISCLLNQAESFQIMSQLDSDIQEFSYCGRRK